MTCLEPLLLSPDNLPLTDMISASKCTLSEWHQNQNAVKENLYFWVELWRKQGCKLHSLSSSMGQDIFLKHSNLSCQRILVTLTTFNTTEDDQKRLACLQIPGLNCEYKKDILKECNLPRNAPLLWSSISLCTYQGSKGGLYLNATWKCREMGHSSLPFIFLLLGD